MQGAGIPEWFMPGTLRRPPNHHDGEAEKERGGSQKAAALLVTGYSPQGGLTPLNSIPRKATTEHGMQDRRVRSRSVFRKALPAPSRGISEANKFWFQGPGSQDPFRDTPIIGHDGEH